MASPINTLKESQVTSRPLLLADFVFPDGTMLHLSTHNGNSAAGGVQFNGADYLGDLADENIDRLASLSEQGVDRIPSATLQISDAGATYFINYERGHGFRGAQLKLTFCMYDVNTQTYSTDSFVPFIGICDQPKLDDKYLSVTATNKLNLTRFNLPTVPISQRCPWVNPSTTADRATAAGAQPGDLFYPCGESRSLAEAPPCQYTKQTCTQPNRFGGVTWQPPQGTQNGREYITGNRVQWINADTTQRYKLYVPLHLGGQLWLNAVAVAPVGDANYTRSEVIVGFGKIDIYDVEVNGIKLSGPTGSGDFRWHYINQGSRDGSPNGDVPYSGQGDPYGSMTAIQVLTPKSVFSPDAIPTVRVKCARSDLRIFRKIVSASGGGGNIVITFDGVNEDCSGNPPFAVTIVGNSWSAANGTFTLTNWTTGPPGTITINHAGTGSGTGGYLYYFASGIIVSGGGQGCTSPWSLLEALQWTAVSYADMDPADWSAAAHICNAIITYTNATGTSGSQSRFSSALAITSRRSAAEVVRAMRQSFGGLLIPGSDGKLHLKIEGPLAEQQPAAVDGSNNPNPISSALRDGTSANGYSAYDFTESNSWGVSRDGIQIASSPNRVSFPFQDPLIDFTQSNFTQFDSVDIGRIQQEVPGGLQVTPEGIATYNQAARIAALGLNKILHGNPSGDSRGTEWYAWRASFRACKLQIGHIVRLTNARFGLAAQQIRITEIQPSRNFETVTLRGHMHNDAWYLDSAGNNADPTYSNKAHDRLARPAFPWCPNTVAPISGDSIFASSDKTFSLQPVASTDAAGNPIVSLQISGQIPVNTPSTINAPVVQTQGTTATTGGTIAGGTTVYACAVAFAAGSSVPSAPSIGFCRIDIPAGTNTNTATVPVLTWDTHTSTWALYAGTSPNLMTLQSSGSGTPSTITITSLVARGQGQPDIEADRIWPKVKPMRHSGILGTQVAAVATNSLTIGGTWTANSLVGYDVSVLGKADGSALPVANYRITANTTGGVLTVAPDPSGTVAVGDVVTIRSKPSVSGTVITDPLWVNPFGPSGLAVSAEKGKTLRVIAGTGRGLTYTVADNTATTITLNSTPQMDWTSRYIVEEPNWSTIADATPFDNSDPSKTMTLSVQITNWQNSTLLIAGYMLDGGGQSFDSLAPVRDIYVFGQPLSLRTISSNDSQRITDQTVLLDCSAGDVTLTLLPSNQWKGRRLVVKHWAGGTYNGIVAAATGQTIDNGTGTPVPSVTLPNVGDVFESVSAG